MIKRHAFVGLILWLSIGFARPCRAVDVLAQAAAGSPYSVATVEIPLDATAARPLSPLDVTSESGRVLFPVAEEVRVQAASRGDGARRIGNGRIIGRIGGLVRDLVGSDDPPERTVARKVSFLIKGQETVRVTLSDLQGPIGTYDLQLDERPEAHRQVLDQWWTSFTTAAKNQIDTADYPGLVESYLLAMLAGRLNLPLPDWYVDPSQDETELLSTLKLIAGAEGAAGRLFRQAAIGSDDLQQATLPLPPAPLWNPTLPNENIEAAVEPLATRVPPECFYIRYGSFENYLWFQDLSSEYGGDITKMLTVRGVESNAFSRVESQLGLQTNQLSRMLGPAVIEDQAIIGRDLFMTDGSTIGVLFKATNALLLRTSLGRDRSARAQDPAVELTNVTIAGRSISFLSSSDNQVRSFLVEDGDYILVTNSRYMARRFLEVGTSGQSLAATPTFRLARLYMPLERNDVIFAYFSPEMLRGLVSPQYMIELRRRIVAKSDIALVHLARLAAITQAVPGNSIDDLIRAGLLPFGFGRRPDGSGTIAFGDQVVDSMRGARGSFTPIADVEVDLVTADEADWYRSIADYYSSQFPSIDPIMAGVQRDTVDGDSGLERITVHAEIAPWDPEKYGWWSEQLGPPTKVAMQFAPDDIIAVQAHVASAQIGPPTHLFAAIKDTVPPEPEEFDGIIKIYRLLRGIPGYLGAWPQPSTLDRLPLGLGRGQPVGPGMSRLIGGLYRYTDGELSVLSFQPEVLNASLPYLRSTNVEDAAQVRLRVGNLSGSQIEGWVNNQLYGLSRESSVAGARFLNLVSRQFQLGPEETLQATRRVLGSGIQCTLGGEYQFNGELSQWVSTAWGDNAAPTNAPAGYRTPVINWLRGAQASLIQYPDRLIADAVIDIARQN